MPVITISALVQSPRRGSSSSISRHEVGRAPSDRHPFINNASLVVRGDLTCARLLPNDVRVTVEQSLPGNLSMEDWQTMKEVIAAVRQAIPDASSKSPGAVLEHVLCRYRRVLITGV